MARVAAKTDPQYVGHITIDTLLAQRISAKLYRQRLVVQGQYCRSTSVLKDLASLIDGHPYEWVLLIVAVVDKMGTVAIGTEMRRDKIFQMKPCLRPQ